MRVLITGGTGFIGSHLAERAISRGYDVTVLGLTDLDSDRANSRLLAAKGARIVSGSILDRSLCEKAMMGVDRVFHLAVAMREAGKGDDFFRRVNIDGTRHLLELASLASVDRFVYCGTIGIFGHTFDGIADEQSPKNPGNIYEITKLDAERLVFEYYDDFGLPVVVLRPADVYGPRDQRLIKLFRGVSKGRFPVFGNGQGRRHMVYISDVVSAFERACEVDEAVGEALIIAGPEICTLAELIELIRLECGSRSYGIRLPLGPMVILSGIVEDVCSKFGFDPPIYRRRMDFFTSDSAFDISKAIGTLGWSPAIGLKEGVRLTYNAYKDRL